MILDMQNTSHILKVAGINHFSACVTLIIIYFFHSDTRVRETKQWSVRKN